MLNVNALKAEMVKNGYNQSSLAEALGMSSRTLYSRLQTGDFGAIEIKKMIDLLNIEDPVAIFFAE